MNLFDLTLGILILLFAFQGFRNGIVREVLTIVGLAAAFFITFRHMSDGAELLSTVFSQSEEVLQLLSAVILFSAVFLTALMISIFIGNLLIAIRLNMINRMFGFIFGGFKMALIISAILLLLAGWGLPSEETRQASLLYSFILRIAPFTFTLIAPFYPGAEYFLEQIDLLLRESEQLI